MSAAVETGPTICYQHPVTGEATDPLPAQKAFHESPAKYRAYVGGMGSGKTLGGCKEAIYQSQVYPNNLGLIARFEFESLRDTTMDTFFEEAMTPELRASCEWRASDKELRFPNGSRILFRHLQNPKKFLSFTPGWFWIDEAIEEGCGPAWEILKKRIRLKGARRNAWVTTNPGAQSSYLFREWDRARATADPRYFMVKARSTENRYLPRDYVDELMHMDADEFQMYVMGEFVAAHGAILYNFRPEVHVVPDFPIPFDWWRIRAIDIGINHPFVCLWMAYDPTGSAVFVYREWVARDLNLEQNAKYIENLSIGETIQWSVIDPAARQRGFTTGTSTVQQLAGYGLTCRCGDNDVDSSINLIRTLLASTTDPRTRRVLSPRLYVMKSCPETARQMETWRYDERRGQAGKPVRKDDDCVAALRYGVMSLPLAGRPEMAYEEPEPSLMERMADQALRRRGEEWAHNIITPSYSVMRGLPGTIFGRYGTRGVRGAMR